MAVDSHPLHRTSHGIAHGSQNVATLNKGSYLRAVCASILTMSNWLTTLDRIKTAMAKALGVADCKQLRDKARAIAVYCRTHADCKAIEREAIVIRLRAERQLGELLAHTVRKCSKSKPEFFLAGSTRIQSSRWQTIC